MTMITARQGGVIDEVGHAFNEHYLLDIWFLV